MIIRIVTHKKSKPGTARGPRFEDLANYIAQGDAAAEVNWYHTGNLGKITAAIDHDLAIMAIEATQALKPELEDRKKNYHLMISMHPQDRTLSSDELALIVDRCLTAVGFDEHQFIAVRHSDQEHEHIHVAVNRMHPKTLRMHYPYKDAVAYQNVAATLERELGLFVIDRKKARARRLGRAAADLEARRGEETFEGWMRDVAKSFDLDRFDSWEGFHRALATVGVTIVPRGRGLALRALGQESARCKASAAGRDWSMQNLTKRFGPYEPPPPGSGAPIRTPEKHAQTEHYERRPAPHLRSDRLWNLYLARVKELRRRKRRSYLGHKVIRALPTTDRAKAELYRARALGQKIARALEPEAPSGLTYKAFLAEQAALGDAEARRLLRLKTVRAAVELRHPVKTKSPPPHRRSSRGARLIELDDGIRLAATPSSIELLGPASEHGIRALAEHARAEFGDAEVQVLGRQPARQNLAEHLRERKRERECL